MTAWEVFLQIAGFALQTIPVAMLMCVPFNDSELRYSRKKTYAILITAVIIASLSFSAAEFTIVRSSSRVQLANLFMLIFIIVEFGIYFFLVKAHILCRLLVMTILIHYAAVLFTCSNIITRLPFMARFLYPAEKELTYGTESDLAFLIVTAVTFPIVLLFMKRVVYTAISINDNKTMKRGFIYLMSALVMFIAASAFFDFNFGRDIYKNFGGIIFFAAFVFTDFIMYYMFFFETNLIIDNNRLMNRIQSFDEQYRRITRGIEESRRLKHDIRHHLSAISTMSRNGEINELNKYLESYSSVYNELDSISVCGYHALDNILRYYLSLAKEKDIDIKTKFQTLNPDMDFDVTDITVLMGNLMENAIEACEQLPETEKFIRLCIRQSETSLLIKSENSCRSDLSAKPDFTGCESFISTKHTKHSGQGLKSISIVAEKYGDSAEFKCENGVFTARAVLNIP